MTVLPSSLALTSIADGSNIVAADHRNNYTAVQTAVNALIADLGAGAAGQVLSGVGTTVSWVYPPGYEYGYAEFTANATVTATTQATASTVVTAPAVTFDGSTAVWVEFFSQSVEPDRAAAARTVSVTLYDGSTALTDFATVVTPTAAEMGVPVRVRRKLTPSAAAHTFSARAYVSAGSGVVTAGDGLSGHAVPGYISVYKA